MHVPWGWIKQRPHFLAEQLSDTVEVDVFVTKSFRTSNLTANTTKLNITTIFKFPFERFKIIRFINIKIVQFLLKYIYCIEKYKYIWITDLRLYSLIQNLLTNKQKLIYDCMDDVLEFEVLKEQQDELENIENKLFQNADLILFSSKELKSRKVEKYNLLNDSYGLVYNALDRSLINAEIFDDYDSLFEEYKQNNYKVLTYIGTISSWFDFEVIRKSLKDFEDIVYFIIGPIEQNIEVLKHDRIKYFGSVEHKYVTTLVLKSDILVMPFKLNKLVLAVDPVKMYEYIAFGKKIISVKYDELEKFSEHLSLYENYDEFKTILMNLSDIKDVNILNNDFIELNTWKKRKEDIMTLLENIS